MLTASLMLIIQRKKSYNEVKNYLKHQVILVSFHAYVFLTLSKQARY